MNFGLAFKLLWVGWLLYWIVCAYGNKRTVERPRSPWRPLFVIGLVVLLLLFHGRSQLWDKQVLPGSFALSTLGLALCAVGLAFAIWARNILGTNWSANPVLKENHELITSGPYRYVRHPIYTGLLLAIFGTALASGTFGSFILFIYVAVGLHFKAKVEEGLMLRQFPDAYPEYTRKTKSIIPFIL
jgi:protein-S-isoprenylcysteine O-methyltransferase Ste14